MATIWVSVILNSFPRFVMSLCIPAIEMLLHTIIAGLLLREDVVGVFKVSDKMKASKTSGQRVMRGAFWVMVSRVVVPMAYVVVALAIVLPGVINVALLE